MVKHSAGIVLCRATDDDHVEILLAHPGGPFWAGKNEHGWSIPKGEFDPDGEAAIAAARREFAEEIGTPAPGEDALEPLAVVKASGKHIHPFLGWGHFDPADLVSNTTQIEWPPRSGSQITIPEVDAVAWIRLEDAESFLHKGQARVVALVRAALA